MRSTRSLLALLVSLSLLALVLSACGGSATTTTAAQTTTSGTLPATTASTTTTTVAPTTTSQASTTTKPSVATTVSLSAPTIVGTIAFETLVGEGDYDLCVVNTDGSGLKTIAGGEGCQMYPQWSPDGKRLLYTQSAVGDIDPIDVWMMNADGSGKKQLTSEALSESLGATMHRNMFGSWSPDGKQIVCTGWVRYPPERSAIFVMNPDSTGAHWVTSMEGKAVDFFPRWAADGMIYFLRIDLTGQPSAEYRVNPDGSGLELVRTLGDIHYTHLTYAPSPDATMVAYQDVTTDSLLVVASSGSGTPATIFESVKAYLGLTKAAVTWSTDGKALAVAGLFDGGQKPFTRLYVVNADGSGLSVVPGISSARDPAWRPQ